jgi:glycosyltransferase involved in cell wall biosynthesis
MDFLAGPASQPRPSPATRKRIMVKGYHGWSGRSLTALSAIRLAAEALREIEIVVPLASRQVTRECERMSKEVGLRILHFAYSPSHADFITELGTCRAMLSIGISDGISTTLLEALAVGAFPIQSDTACADEWVEHGRSGFIVSPYDTRQISDAIIAAATDDDLVEHAAPLNRETVEKRWNAGINGERMRALYRECRQRSRVP